MSSYDMKSGNGSAAEDRSKVDVGSVADEGEGPSTSTATVSLKKNTSLLGGVALIAGTMIGSGIFISPGGVLERSGSVGGSLLVWTGCGILAMFGALAYAELGAMIHKSGGEWAYLMASYSPLHKQVGPSAPFLFVWVSTVVIKPSSVAIICLAFSEYLLSLFYDDCGPPDVVLKLLAIVAIFALVLINIVSPKLANQIQIIFFGIKLTALLIIIIGGFYALAQNLEPDNYLTPSKSFITDKPPTASSIASAFYQGLWAYDGWNNLNYVTEELTNPSRNIPLAIIIAIPLVTVVYLLANVAYFTLLTPMALIESNAVATSWAYILVPSAAWLVPVAVAFSTFGAANGSILSSSRLVYSAAREGHSVSILSMVHVDLHSPSASIIFTALVAILMLIPADIFTLIDFFSFTSWLFYGLTMGALVILRYTHPEMKRPFRCPIPIPILVLAISVYLVIAPIIETPDLTFLYAAIFTFAGLLFYVPFVVYKWVFPGFESVTCFLQRFMRIIPPEDIEQLEEKSL